MKKHAQLKILLEFVGKLFLSNFSQVSSSGH